MSLKVQTVKVTELYVFEVKIFKMGENDVLALFMKFMESLLKGKFPVLFTMAGLAFYLTRTFSGLVFCCILSPEGKIALLLFL